MKSIIILAGKPSSQRKVVKEKLAAAISNCGWMEIDPLGTVREWKDDAEYFRITLFEVMEGLDRMLNRYSAVVVAWDIDTRMRDRFTDKLAETGRSCLIFDVCQELSPDTMVKQILMKIR